MLLGETVLAIEDPEFSSPEREGATSPSSFKDIDSVIREQAAEYPDLHEKSRESRQALDSQLKSNKDPMWSSASNVVLKNDDLVEGLYADDRPEPTQASISEIKNRVEKLSLGGEVSQPQGKTYEGFAGSSASNVLLKNDDLVEGLDLEAPEKGSTNEALPQTDSSDFHKRGPKKEVFSGAACRKELFPELSNLPKVKYPPSDDRL